MPTPSPALPPGISAPPGTTLVTSPHYFDGPVLVTADASFTVNGPTVVNGAYTTTTTATTLAPEYRGATLNTPTLIDGVIFLENTSTSFDGTIDLGTQGAFARHFKGGGPAATTSQVSLGTAFAAGSTVNTVTGTDLNGRIQVTSATGTTPPGAVTAFTFTFSSPLPSAPRAIMVKSYNTTTQSSPFSLLQTFTASSTSIIVNAIPSYSYSSSVAQWTFFYLFLL
jgi:hypothetical protein